MCQNMSRVFPAKAKQARNDAHPHEKKNGAKAEQKRRKNPEERADETVRLL